MGMEVVGGRRHAEGMQPTAELLALPAVYGKPKRITDWGAVYQRLETSERYWLATTRPDGRPHVVPVDGVWVDGLWYFGGHKDTVHQRNLRTNTKIALHLEDAMSVVIVEGDAEWIKPSTGDAKRIATASNDKYGYGATAKSYREGTWALRPRVVIAWSDLLNDATRFTFPSAGTGDQPAPRPRRGGSPSSARRRPANSRRRDPDPGT
jgi:Pyridoxamine 5'-phosphate oxidase